MPPYLSDDPSLTQAALAGIEQRVTVLTLAIERQSAQIGRIADVLADLRNRSDWQAAQVSELLRILAASLREIRETQVYSLLAEGPVSAADLAQLQAISAELPERAQHRQAPGAA